MAVFEALMLWMLAGVAAGDRSLPMPPEITVPLRQNPWKVVNNSKRVYLARLSSANLMLQQFLCVYSEYLRYDPRNNTTYRIMKFFFKKERSVNISLQVDDSQHFYPPTLVVRLLTNVYGKFPSASENDFAVVGSYEFPVLFSDKNCLILGHQNNKDTIILLWIFVVKITDVLYKKEIMTKVLKSLFPHRGAPVLRERAVDVRNPFNKSDTLFRFRIMDGRLFMRGTRAVKGMEVCKFIRAPRPHAYCRLPIPGSFATYNCTLSHGRNVTDRFKINLTMKQYPGWVNPADISGYFDVTNFPKHPRLALSSVFVTEFSIDTTSSPPFENFTVFDRFKRNQTLIKKVWHNFEEFVFRKCKQDIRNLTKLVYTKRMKGAAVAVGEFDLMTLIK